ncbi:hypothetical protein BD324DRAFT_679226 [Kockovaella imperatae]|uniref:SEC7 domain-containing protein n=1 Tax=Kockovaella imperatae TaxID=4999 RepID=A0A1Y1UQ69_9TREE|nr:hypothetical protein BD324DRAFT_679226 [Kockovaella imperatae]ORX40181.1 hypothetical protein BD324DRAFT_679226 [Kockovaella imperatae]
MFSASPIQSHASKPGSRSGRPASPEDASQVRSQAVAKLKRAASLPRKSDGRRPDRLPLNSGQEAGERCAAVQNDASTLNDAVEHVWSETHPSSLENDPPDDQEVLSPSPVAQYFSHADMYGGNYSTPGLQRSGSSSSSYHIPTPPQMTFGQMGTGYHAATPSSSTMPPDWAAMQLAQSYLPSLSPVPLPLPPSPYLTAGLSDTTPGPSVGRHTPSPLPTLGDLRNLQRSNSAAARAQAMSKLTGGRDTPSDGEGRAPTPLVQGGAPLQRAGTVGAPRFLGMPQPTPQPAIASPVEVLQPDSPEARPRLKRSFTVSSSNMGEERRSAVGRRMVERLAERRAAREKEEEQVRKLWEQRRAAAEASQSTTDAESEEDDGDGQPRDDEDLTETLPIVSRTSPVQEAAAMLAPPDGDNGLLSAPDRPASRGTMRSADEPFQYDSHLSRSLSTRTAKGTPAVIQERTAAMQDQPHTPDNDPIGRFNGLLNGEMGTATPQYTTPRRGLPHDSTSMDLALAGSVSPGESIMSRDVLGSMMFIMGRGSTTGPVGVRSRSGENWPSEVEENSGSDWGTPGREAVGGPVDSPLQHSPLGNRLSNGVPPQVPPKDNHSTASIASSIETRDSQVPPNASSIRDSTMSWEELGGPEDRAVPFDVLYHKKSGSMSAKIGRKIGTAIRKRSQSRSSASSSMTGEPMSPNSLSVVQTCTRRRSESSMSPGSASATRSMSRGSPNIAAIDPVRHQASISSLSPSLPSQADSAHTSLLQHQLENPSQTSFMPRADLNDPRIYNAKMSPFPGIANWEGMSTDPTPETSPQIAARNDLPATSRNDRPSISHGYLDSIVSASTSPDVGSRRESEESYGKRSWLAKAFGQQISPRSSASGMSRQGSSAIESGRSEPLPQESTNRSASSSSDPSTAMDPFAPPPAPKIDVRSVSLQHQHRSASPSVSVVPELSEEGSRLTRFTQATARPGTSTPRMDDTDIKSSQHAHADDVVQKMKRLDDLLTLSSDDPSRPDLLDDPPRKLLLAHQVLQVVNSHTVKDRFLLLFNDILVVAKPLLTRSLTANLDMEFVVKSVVPLNRVRISAFEGSPSSSPQRHLLDHFVDRFAEDPFLAVKNLVNASEGRANTTSIALILFNTPHIDREQLGIYLANDERVLRAYLQHCHIFKTRIDVALRHFLMTLRSPLDSDAFQLLLRNFAKYHFDANQTLLPYSRELAIELVFAIMELHDDHHGIYGFGKPGTCLKLDDFVKRFRSNDPHRLVPAALLEDIYFAITRNIMPQALNTHDHLDAGVEVETSPLISKLPFNVWSKPVRVTLPDIDPDFEIHLHGDGLEFDPPVLAFDQSAEASFVFRGKALGQTSIVFDRRGLNAIFYASMETGKTITIERGFMRHTFKVEFTTPPGDRRKYCFSLAHSETFARWANHLPRQVALVKQASLRVPVTIKERLRYAAEKMALAVLQDALAFHEPAPSHENGASPQKLRKSRSGSVSLAYASQDTGEKEAQLASFKNVVKTSETVFSKAAPMESSNSGPVQTGKELVLLCRQNSLLPGILELLEPGFGGLGTDLTRQPIGLESRSGRSTPLIHHVHNGSKSGRSTPLSAQLFPQASISRSRNNTPLPDVDRHRGMAGMI